MVVTTGGGRLAEVVNTDVASGTFLIVVTRVAVTVSTDTTVLADFVRTRVGSGWVWLGWIKGNNGEEGINAGGGRWRRWG